jgi:hypothetical protein
MGKYHLCMHRYPLSTHPHRTLLGGALTLAGVVTDLDDRRYFSLGHASAGEVNDVSTTKSRWLDGLNLAR